MASTAAANRSMLSIETFSSPRSTEPMYVRCKLAVCARASCETPMASRRKRRLRPNIFLALAVRLTRIETRWRDAFKATDLT